MIYVLQVSSGTELDVIGSLLMKDIIAYAPRQELLERRRGTWNKVQKFIFPGYVFADVQLTDDNYYKLKETDGVLRILGNPTPLSYSEEQRMRWLFSAGVLGISRGYVKDGRLMITYGLPAGRENEIISFSSRQKRC